MQGADGYDKASFSTIRLKDCMPANHPLRPIRQRVNEGLSMDERLSSIYEADVEGGQQDVDAAIGLAGVAQRAAAAGCSTVAAPAAAAPWLEPGADAGLEVGDDAGGDAGVEINGGQ